MSVPLKYNIRNLFRRKMRTSLTVIGISLVVAVAVIMLAYSRGISHSLRHGGDPENIIIVSKRAGDRVNSSVSRSNLSILLGMISEEIEYYNPEGSEDVQEEQDESEDGGIDLDAMTEDLGSGPIDLVAPFIEYTAKARISEVQREDGQASQAVVVGVDPLRAPHIYSRYKLLEGRELKPDDAKVAMVGSMVYARFGIRKEDVKIGYTIQLTDGTSWKIVGIFDAPGTPAATDIWVPISELSTTMQRTDYSYIVARIAKKEGETGEKTLARTEEIAQQIGSSERVELSALTEVKYMTTYTGLFRAFATFGIVMAFVIMLGGLTAGINTMYTAVTGRIREIGMLQVLGYSKRSIITSFVIESVLMSIFAGLVGCAIGTLVNGIPMKLVMSVFVFRVDLTVIAGGMAMAVAIGVVGALIPSIRGTRLRMVDAVRYV